MKKIILAILFLPVFVFSQEVLITPLPGKINTINAEINFVQVNDTIAYFTVVNEENGKIESNIYFSNWIDQSWGLKKYAEYNFDFFNTANIFFSKDGLVLFSICNHEMQNCKIVALSSGNDSLYNIDALFSDVFYNTQPIIVSHKSSKALYFVSNRNGGFGGLDIWLSIIDNDGKFGAPINLGSKINSYDDDITPFYNQEEGMMYFSSNKKGGLGGFDIYKSKGVLNLWEDPQNVKELNSPQDELYLTFYDAKLGHFSSNRKGAKYQYSEYCCNDVFVFEYLKNDEETLNINNEIQQYLPLDLYFHNDEPEPGTTNITTNKTYKDAYVSYFMMKEEYELENTSLNNFFEDTLQKNFNCLNRILELLLVDLFTGAKIEIIIKGYASPLHDSEYNQKLSQRRISSAINYIAQFKNGEFKKYISSKNLVIKQLPYGEKKSSEKVSSDEKDKKKSVYSNGAILERKIQIVSVSLRK